MQGIHRSALLATMLSLAVVACSGSSSTATEPQGSAPEASAPGVATSLESAAASVTSDLSPGSAIAQPTVAEAVSVTTPIPPILQITAPLIGGGEFDFGAYAGKPLAVWFWAPG